MEEQQEKEGKERDWNKNEPMNLTPPTFETRREGEKEKLFFGGRVCTYRCKKLENPLVDENKNPRKNVLLV